MSPAGEPRMPGAVGGFIVQARAVAAPPRLRYIAAVAAVALANALAYATLNPPFHGPDEPAHFDYVQALAENRRLPERKQRCLEAPLSAEARELKQTLLDGDVFDAEAPLRPLEAFHPPPPEKAESRATTGCGPASYWPPAYYLSLAIGYGILHARSLPERLFAARAVSSLWGMAFALFTLALGAAFFSGVREAFPLGLAAAAHPMVGFLAGSVNGDAALLACVAASLLAIVRAARDPSTARLGVVAVVAGVAGAFSKASFALYLPILFVLLACALGPRDRRSWMRAARAFAPGAVAAVAWWAIAGEPSDGLASPSGLSDLLRRHLFDIGHARHGVLSGYWASFGFDDTVLSPGYYRLTVVLAALAVAGFALNWGAADRGDRFIALAAVASTLVLGGIVLATAWKGAKGSGEVFAQGRYLLPLFPLHALATMRGVALLSRRLSAALSAAWALPALVLVLDLAAILRLVERYHA